MAYPAPVTRRGLPIASFKLHFIERRARVVPRSDASGCPFVGPGVDLVGAQAAEVVALAGPLLAWLVAREPVRVRTLSLDVGRRRLLATLVAEPRPRVVKIDPGIDPGASAQLVALSEPLLDRLGELAREALAARGQH